MLVSVKKVTIKDSNMVTFITIKIIKNDNKFATHIIQSIYKLWNLFTNSPCYVYLQPIGLGFLTYNFVFSFLYVIIAV